MASYLPKVKTFLFFIFKPNKRTLNFLSELLIIKLIVIKIVQRKLRYRFSCFNGGGGGGGGDGKNTNVLMHRPLCDGERGVGGGKMGGGGGFTTWL